MPTDAGRRSTVADRRRGQKTTATGEDKKIWGVGVRRTDQLALVNFEGEIPQSTCVYRGTGTKSGKLSPLHYA